LYRIAHRFEVDTTVLLDGRIEEGKMALHRLRHSEPVPLPAFGAAFNIREEEGDNAARQLRHHPRLGSALA
jgi:hypothetical protein